MAVALFLSCVSGFAQDLADDARLISLAREAIIAEVSHKAVTVSICRTPPQPVFVTVERKGLVRGCRGSLDTKQASLEAAIVAAARGAAAHDPRYKPLRREELFDIKITITVVERLESIEGVGSLQPEDGLVLTSGTKTGVVLPWEGRDPETRLAWAYKKAGISRGSAVRLSKLIGRRFQG